MTNIFEETQKAQNTDADEVAIRVSYATPNQVRANLPQPDVQPGSMKHAQVRTRQAVETIGRDIARLEQTLERVLSPQLEDERAQKDVDVDAISPQAGAFHAGASELERYHVWLSNLIDRIDA